MGTTYQLPLPDYGSRVWATSVDELELHSTKFPLLAKAPSERSKHRSVAAQTLGTETLSDVYLSLLCTHATVSIFIFYSLVLTKLLAAGSREEAQSTRSSDVCIFSPKAFATGSHWRQDAVLCGLLIWCRSTVSLVLNTVVLDFGQIA